MIGLCEVNWSGCHEGESREPMPAPTLGQGVEQNVQRVIRISTDDKIDVTDKIERPFILIAGS